MAGEDSGPNFERTLAMVKPDGVLMGHVEDITNIYEGLGLNVVEKYDVHFSFDDAGNFYQDHEGKFYFTGLRLALSSGECRVLILEGENAIEQVRKINGSTNPAEALPGTIRHDYRSAGGPFNTVHSSDSSESFEREYWLVRNISG